MRVNFDPNRVYDSPSSECSTLNIDEFVDLLIKLTAYHILTVSWSIAVFFFYEFR